MQANKELLKNEKRKLLNNINKLIPLYLKVIVGYSTNYKYDTTYCTLLDNWLYICDISQLIEDDINNDK